MASRRYTSKVSSKGQVTVPVEIRRRLGLRAGDSLAFVAERNRTVVQPVHQGLASFSEYEGILPFLGDRDAVVRYWREMRDEDED